MIDNDIMREHRERIELHKQKYLNGNYSKRNDEQETGSFAFRSILCMFIFATLLVLNLTDSTMTRNISTSIKTTITTDKLPYIINLVENANSYDLGLNKLKTEAEAMKIDAQNFSSEPTNPKEPATEFTIDENMLNEINDSDLLGKK